MMDCDILDVVSYCQETGNFTWTSSVACRIKAGNRAGSHDRHGYWRISYKGKTYPAHRLAWFIANGDWPNGMIDHINGVRDDNRICNLREATNSLNQANRSGVRGITFHKGVGKYQAQIKVDGKNHYLGIFDDKEAAAIAYAEAAVRHFGEYSHISRGAA